MSGVLTLTKIAKDLGVPTTRIDYVIKSRRLRPMCFAGNARVFDEETAATIAAEVRKIESRRDGPQR